MCNTKRRKYRALMIAYDLSIANGVSSYIMNYYHKINHTLIDIDFALFNDAETPYYDDIRKHGGKVFFIPSVKNIKEHMEACRNIIKNGQYDIIHDNILLPSLFILYFSKKYNVPVRILHSHSSKLSNTKRKAIRNKLLLPLLLRNANYYIACSKTAGNCLFLNKKYAIIPNIISVFKYKFNDISRRLIRKKSNNNGKIIIGSVGRLAVEKNPIFAIRTILEFAKNNTSVEYWWIGDGELQTQVVNYIKEHDTNHIVKLLGNRTDVADLYQAMDLFFLPSQFEGLPVTALEAQASGLPCLVSDTVSDEFVYTDLVTFFSLNDDIPKITNIIRFLLSKKYDRSVYGQKLQESRFSDSNAGANLLQLYREMLEKENHN